jgi:DNA-binding MarR family transcriptional regulator
MIVIKGDIPEPARPATPWLLRRANRRYRQAIRAGLSKAGFNELPPEGWWALDALAHGEPDATALVTVMGTSRQAASKLVETLVAAGYVSRGADEGDRRRVRLTLTTRGRRAATSLARTVAQVDAELAAEIGPERLELVRAVLGLVPGPALPGEHDVSELE